MGINYYLRHKLSLESKELLQKAIDEDNLPEIERLTKPCRAIHIGKASSGWRFLWDANYFSHYGPTVKFLHEWLQSGEIYDECGDHYTYEEFMKELEERNTPFNQHDASTWEHMQTMKGESKSFFPRDQRFFDWFTDRYGLDVDLYGEFYLKDENYPLKEYRFTVDSNFL